MNKRIELSVIVPAYNEAEIIEHSLGVISSELATNTNVDGFEIIIVNDGLSDKTAEIVGELAVKDERIVPINFSRNFGKEAALAAGLEHAQGAAIVLIDADLQHPPSTIKDLLVKWREGFDVVEAVKTDRGQEGLAYKMMAAVFNTMMGTAVGKGFGGASDFKLLDRQVVDAINSCGERKRFFRGLTAWVGFKIASVPFEVAERVGGVTKWSTRALIKYSLNNLLAFSSVPLRLVAMLGFITVCIGFIFGGHTLYNYIRGEAVEGYTTVILLLIILGGLILLSIGIVAIYISQIYEEQKKRPIFIVRKNRSIEMR